MSPGNSTPDSSPSGSSKSTALFYNVVKSLREFDQYEVNGVVETLLSKTDRDQCFIATYYRGVANVDTLLTLESVRHFQAVAMMARGLFELAVDMRLLEVVVGGPDKMVLFADVESSDVQRRLFATRGPIQMRLLIQLVMPHSFRRRRPGLILHTTQCGRI